MTTKVKPSIVEINRFYRPRGTVIGKYKILPDEILSDRGVTVMFTLDYEKETFTARYSVCKGDNFDRAIGIAYAQACEFPVTGKLVRGVPLAKLLEKSIWDNINNVSADIFLRSTRNLSRLLVELCDSSR